MITIWLSRRAADGLSWRLVLSEAARKLVILFIVLGVVLGAVNGAVQAALVGNSVSALAAAERPPTPAL